MMPFKMTFEIDFGEAGRFRGSMDVQSFDTVRVPFFSQSPQGNKVRLFDFPACGTIVATNIVMQPITD